MLFDNIKSLVTEHAGEAIFNNPAIPDNKNQEIVSNASSSIVNGLKSAVTNGNFDNLKALFANGGEAVASSPVTKNIENGFVQNLVLKLGLNEQKAGSIAKLLIPLVMQKLVHKTNDAGDDSFNLSNIITSLATTTSANNILSSVTGGNTDDLLGKVKGFFK